MSAPGACLYDARTVHVRFQPLVRRLSYRVFQVFLDVDDIAAPARATRLFSAERFNLLSFYNRDHGARDGKPLRAWAEALFAANNVALEGGAIRLLCFPRVLGYVFNPISVFFGYAPDGALRGVIYEVNNTFGETHAYVAPLPNGANVHKHGAAKAFHVSPFFDVAGAYAFGLREPGAQMSLTIENQVKGVRTHIATLKGKALPFTDGAILKLVAAMPFMTLKVIAGIHWEALWIWLRGAGYRAKPPPPASPFSTAAPWVRPQLFLSGAWTDDESGAGKTRRAGCCPVERLDETR